MLFSLARLPKRYVPLETAFFLAVRKGGVQTKRLLKRNGILATGMGFEHRTMPHKSLC
jgi:hypothetical protein